MKPSARTLVRAASFVPALVAGWCFLGVWLAPDGCLDLGGSFDYVAWQCSHTQNFTYINVPAYELVSFWWLVLTIVFLVAALAWLRPRQNAV
jgi:hypothetical protein